MKTNVLDQFYTNPKVADYLVCKIKQMFDLNKYSVFEPAAGCGNFIDALYKNGFDVLNKCYAYDIDPKTNPFIKKTDFLKFDISQFKNNKKNNMVITNPPFGKKGLLAVDFLNKCLEFADVVCMILPNTFNRFLTQNKINHSAKLIYSQELDHNSFLVNDRQYSVKCVFQIWVNKDFKCWITDKRLKSDVISKINGLQLFIHNNTKQTLKYFNKEEYDWNFAITRQGYYDYNQKVYDQSQLIKNRQYVFIKTNNQYLLNIINQIDFDKLANSNTTIKGFSNTDLVSEIYKIHIKNILKF